MTYIGKPKFTTLVPVNGLGHTHRDYEGSVSTLCAGCGHDAIALRSSKPATIEPAAAPIAKLCGIGCSSKTPTYMLGPATVSIRCMAACPRC